MESNRPIYILTLKIDDDSLHFFTAKRTSFFPVERNYLAAHLTLFHYLPMTIEEILADLKKTLHLEKPFKLTATGLMSLGAGVAYRLESDRLQQLHRSLQLTWKNNLKPQDLQKIRPHITVQNKVSVETVKATLETLQNDFKPFEVTALGVSVWEYLGGPWRFVADFRYAEGNQ